jgi:hypothetical protein
MSSAAPCPTMSKASARCVLVRRFVLPTSLADRTAKQRAQKATSDRLSSSSSSKPGERSVGVLEYWSIAHRPICTACPRGLGVLFRLSVYPFRSIKTLIPATWRRIQLTSHPASILSHCSRRCLQSKKPLGPRWVSRKGARPLRDALRAGSLV